MDDPQTFLYTTVAVLVALYIVRWRTHPVRSLPYVVTLTVRFSHMPQSQLSKIPTLGGSSAPGLSYLTALNLMRNGKELINEGYHRVCIGDSAVSSRST